MKDMEIVILTKSSKNNGYCVAGIDINDGKWVRLISDDEDSHGALFYHHMKYDTGTTCEILDVVKAPCIQKNPSPYQPENVLIDTNQCWKKLGKYSIEQVLQKHPSETHPRLLGNTSHFLTEAEIASVGHPLHW